MATLELRLSSKVQKDTSRSEILLRLYQGSRLNLRAKSGVFVSPCHFEYFIDRKRTQAVSGIRLSEKTITSTTENAVKHGYVLFNRGDIFVRNRIDSEDKTYHDNAKKKIENLKRVVMDAYESANESNITSEWLQALVDKFHHPETFAKNQNPDNNGCRFFSIMEDFITKKPSSPSQIKGVHVLMRALARYERFVQKTDKSRKSFIWDIETATKEDIENFESYFRNERVLSEEYPKLFVGLLSEYPASISQRRKSPMKVENRGNNTVIILMKKFKAFWAWLIREGLTTNNPFLTVTIGTEKYGTPYYISIEERNRIADFDLSFNPHLEAQRDIFIFQCCIGCRVSDMLCFKSSDIIEGEINYIPRKTKSSDPATVKVPLNDRAKKLVEKYKGVDKKGRLFPFISAQKYNDSIKEFFSVCGITRMVTVLDSATGKEIKQPINEIASSHMARRTFIGNLYRRVKDPNLIGKLSGHVEGSKAFARYRDIDKETREETVKLID